MDTSQFKLLIVDSEDWTFWFHRLSLALTVKATGAEVKLLTRCNDYADQIKEKGINIANVDFVRSSKLPFNDLANILKLRRTFKQYKPDIIHNVALKTILISSIAALGIKNVSVVNAFTGLGYVFSSQQFQARLIRFFIKPVFKYFAQRPNYWTIFQNPDDMQLFIAQGLAVSERSILIRGSGVDTNEFIPTPDVNETPVVMLASRMLWDKGIGEFVDAAKRAQLAGLKATFVLVGDVDPDNPMSIPETTLKMWSDEGYIEWQGHNSDMPQKLAMASIVCLPSYREGLPKVLLEAAAVGRPLIATDVPGCREIVKNNENGLLVELKNVDSLYNAIQQLVSNKDLREEMGRNSRNLVESELSTEIINAQTIKFYKSLLNECP
ncbi:MAG: glycosyl transferase family 1 [marine bacterium B5-7]|nr:MAG: glycosyl transferase family 1 [marine bacterium B5-7]